MKVTPKLLVYLLVLIAVLYGFGLLFDLFYNWPWFDIPMHFLGGLFVGLLFFYLFGYFFGNDDIFRNKIERIKVAILAIGFVVLVGVLWEFFEFFLDYFFFTNQIQGIADTLGDLLMDIVGGAAAGAWILFIKNK